MLHIKTTSIWKFASLLCALLISVYAYNLQSVKADDNLPVPAMKAQIICNTSGNPLAIVGWDVADPSQYGFKLDKAGVKGREVAEISNPTELGLDEEATGGMYVDDALVPGDTYNYYATTFDRGGDESGAAQLTVQADASVCEAADEETDDTGDTAATGDDANNSCPAAPLSLNADVNGDKVALNWNKICPASQYDVYADEKLVAVVTGRSFSLSDVVPGKHKYIVKALGSGDATPPPSLANLTQQEKNDLIAKSYAAGNLSLIGEKSIMVGGSDQRQFKLLIAGTSLAIMGLLLFLIAKKRVKMVKTA